MIPEDKFGQPIYRRLFGVLQKQGKILEQVGYREAKSKPNLFYCKTPEGVFFADMRGTAEIPIWSDPSPLFYWKFTDEVPNWLRLRMIKRELEKLFSRGCPCRLSFESSSSPEFQEACSYVDEENGIFDWDDGYCIVCNKDFSGPGSFCSDECRLKYEESQKRYCEVCGKEIPGWDVYDSVLQTGEKCAVCGEALCEHNSIQHHISYFPEKTINVHRGCHIRIHRSDDYPALRPDQSDVDRYYGKG